MAAAAGLFTGLAQAGGATRGARQHQPVRCQGGLRPTHRGRRARRLPHPQHDPHRAVTVAGVVHRGVGRRRHDPRADRPLTAPGEAEHTGPTGDAMPRPTGSAVLPPERAGSPGSLIVSFAGSYLRELGGWIAVADLIRCLETVGLGEPSTRQALVRLKSRGFLAAQRRAGEAGYLLTDAGRHDLSTGDRRIFRPATAIPEDGWVLAVFAVPETERHLRHQLRTELSWLGFGTVSPGVWIAPRPLADPTRSLLTQAGLAGYVTWFGAEHLSDIDVAAWWDLDSLRDQ